MSTDSRDINSELLGLVAGRKSQTGGKSRVSELFSSSGSDSDNDNDSSSVEEDQDGQDFIEETRSTPSPKEESRTFKNKRGSNLSSAFIQKNEEDGFGDGFGPDLMGDEADRTRLANMTEVEREAVLYERAQARLAKAERRELEKKMRALEQAEQQRPTRAPSASMEKKRRTLDELRARREKRRRNGDSDSDYYEEGEAEREDTSSKVEDLYYDKGQADYQVGRKKRIGHNDDTMGKELVTLDLVNQMLINRNSISKWIFHPEFDELARGCFVRLSVSRGNEQVYRPCEIKKIVKYHRNYKVNDVATGKAAILKYGKNEKTFRFDVVSNSPFTEAEFARWIETMKEEHQPIMTKRVAENKSKAWKELESRPMSDEIVSAMVAAKRELGSAPRNLIAERTILSHLRDEAIGMKNYDEVERIDEELIQLAKEQAISSARSAPDSRLQALTELNKRNRRLNVTTNSEVELRGSKRSEADNRHDPFSRRKTQPTDFNAFFDRDQANSHSLSNDNDNEDGNVKSDIGKDHSPSEEFKKDQESSPIVAEEDVPPGPVDLFAAHNVDIEIDI